MPITKTFGLYGNEFDVVPYQQTSELVSYVPENSSFVGVPPLLAYVTPPAPVSVVPPTATHSFFGDILSNLGNIASNALNTITSTITGQVTSAVVQNASSQQSVGDSLSNLGATVMQGSISKWFVKNWYYLVAGLIAATLLVKFIYKPKSNTRRK